MINLKIALNDIKKLDNFFFLHTLIQNVLFILFSIKIYMKSTYYFLLFCVHYI